MVLIIALVILKPPAAPIPNTGFLVTRFERIVHPMLDCGIECGNGLFAKSLIPDEMFFLVLFAVLLFRKSTPFPRLLAFLFSRGCVWSTWYQVYGVKSRKTLLYGMPRCCEKMREPKEWLMELVATILRLPVLITTFVVPQGVSLYPCVSS